jgi:glycosyltransferase involved in cell wall biosynthesis
MNILMVGPHRNVRGGISTVVNNYYKASLIELATIDYVPTVIDGSKISKFFYGIGSYLRILEKLIFQKIDIVHVHMASRNSFFRKSLIVNLAKIFKKKIIIHLHGAEFDVFFHNELKYKGKKKVRRIFNKADLIIALGSGWEKKITEYCDTNIEIVYNSIYINDKNLYNNQSVNLLMMGRLGERKGIYDLIESFCKIVEKGINFKLILAGDGEIDNVKKIIKEKQIEKYVEVLGWVNNEQKENLLKDTLIYILPSYNEGMPMSILEAISYGIPCIATDVGDIPDVIKNEYNGFIIKPGDIDSLTNCIIKIRNDSNMRMKMSNNAYITAVQKFDIESNCEKILKIYNNLLKK